MILYAAALAYPCASMKEAHPCFVLAFFGKEVSVALHAYYFGKEVSVEIKKVRKVGYVRYNKKEERDTLVSYRGIV